MMNFTSIFILLLLAYSSVAAFFATWHALAGKGWLRWVIALLALVQLALGIAFYGGSPMGQAFLLDFLRKSVVEEKINLVAIILGVGMGIAAFGPLTQILWGRLRELAMAAGLLVSCAALGMIWIRQQMPELIYGQPLKYPGISLETVGQLANEPICVCTGDGGKVFVSYDSFLDGREEGGVIVFEQTEGGSWKSNRSSPGGLFGRTNGLFWNDGALYASRSGRFVRATRERLVYEKTGAVTRCRDQNGDGVFDEFLDVVTDLPGLRIPDSQHSNNGVAIDSKGNLFVAVGTPTNRSVHVDEIEGTILKYAPGSTVPEIFARGFRNPFGMTLNSRDELFITDNDSNNNRGDEVDYVQEGQHYGHPYVLPGDEGVDEAQFRQPLWNGGERGNLTGLVYLSGGRLPKDFQDCILVADLPRDSIFRLKLERDGDKLSVVSSDLFANLPRPVGIAFDGDRSLFVITRRPDNKLYRLTFDE